MVIIWVLKIFFVQFFCVFLPPLLISSASVRSMPFLSFIEPFAWSSLGVSNFLEEISSLSHSVVFLCFFALITEEGFLISPCYSLELCLQIGIFFLFSFAFRFSVLQLIVRPSQTAILVFCISFPWEWSWSLSPVQCREPPSIVHQALSIRSSPLNLFLTSTK